MDENGLHFLGVWDAEGTSILRLKLEQAKILRRRFLLHNLDA
jgi:hypothetical protein